MSTTKLDKIIKQYHGLNLFTNEKSLDFTKLKPSTRCKVRYIRLVQGKPNLVEGSGAVLSEGYTPDRGTIQLLVIEDAKKDVSFYTSGAVVLTMGNNKAAKKATAQRSEVMEFNLDEFNKTWTAQLI